jgi:hypothetical protein
MNFNSEYKRIAVLNSVEYTDAIEVHGLTKLPNECKMFYRKNSNPKFNHDTFFKFFKIPSHGVGLVPLSINLICEEEKREYGVVELTTFHINCDKQDFAPSILESLLEYYQNKGMAYFRYTFTHKSEKTDEPVNAYFMQLVDKKLFSKKGPCCNFILNHS